MDDIFAHELNGALMQENSLAQYDAVAGHCRQLFEDKTRDYGTAWRILRLSSLTDQIFIKGRRIRSIEEKGVQMIGDSAEQEFMAIVNYGLMALIQSALGTSDRLELTLEEALAQYDKTMRATRALFVDKNHDYGEVWRDMRVSSMTDLILMKILRIKQIEDNAGNTLVSEGVEGNYQDIVNYAIFALIKLSENHDV